MGWTSYLVPGKIDRKSECDKLFNGEKHLKILKSATVGSTYFAAIQLVQKYDNSLGDFVDVPEENRRVKAFIVLTSINTDHSGTWFSYKDMTEDFGPHDYRCPESILKLLSPTDNNYANEWREGCRSYQQKKNELRKAAYISCWKR